MAETWKCPGCGDEAVVQGELIGSAHSDGCPWLAGWDEGRRSLVSHMKSLGDEQRIHDFIVKVLGAGSIHGRIHPIRSDGRPVLVAGCDCESCLNIIQMFPSKPPEG